MAGERERALLQLQPRSRARAFATASRRASVDEESRIAVGVERAARRE